MFRNSAAGPSKLYAGLAGIAALALFTACTAEDPGQDGEPADQNVEPQETTPAGDGTGNETNAGTADNQEATTDAPEATDGATGGDDAVYSVIEAVEAEYSGGFIVDIDREDDGSMYEVNVVVDNEVHELDVSSDGNITVDDRDNDDDDDIQEAEQATVTVTDALDEAFSQHADATFDEIQLDEDDGSLHWEIDLDDDIELNVPAT